MDFKISKIFTSAALASIFLLSGCSSIQKSLSFLPGIQNPDTTKVRSVQICATENANQDPADALKRANPTQMEVLFILDKDLTATLPETAKDWFNGRTRILTNNKQTLVTATVGLPAGLSAEADLPDGYKKAQDVIAYANYFSSGGQKWLRLPNSKSAVIQLESQSWSFTDSCTRETS